MPEISAAETTLPIQGVGKVSTAWWGVLCLIGTEGILFVYLIFSYAYLGMQAPGTWPPTGKPSLLLAGPNTIILVVSSFALLWGIRGLSRIGAQRRLRIALAITIILGVIFLCVQGFEWSSRHLTLQTNSYGSIYFTLTGIHMVHVALGVIMLLTLLCWSLMGRLDTHPEYVRLGAVYWHFVDVVWLAIFTAIYVIPWVS
jgi:heme/copper-type cytochrome/quinol oxidase subunit 3